MASDHQSDGLAGGTSSKNSVIIGSRTCTAAEHRDVRGRREDDESGLGNLGDRSRRRSLLVAPTP